MMNSEAPVLSSLLKKIEAASLLAAQSSGVSPQQLCELSAAFTTALETNPVLCAAHQHLETNARDGRVALPVAVDELSALLFNASLEAVTQHALAGFRHVGSAEHEFAHSLLSQEVEDNREMNEDLLVQALRLSRARDLSNLVARLAQMSVDPEPEFAGDGEVLNTIRIAFKTLSSAHYRLCSVLSSGDPDVFTNALCENFITVKSFCAPLRGAAQTALMANYSNYVRAFERTRYEVAQRLTALHARFDDSLVVARLVHPDSVMPVLQCAASLRHMKGWRFESQKTFLFLWTIKKSSPKQSNCVSPLPLSCS